MKPWLLVAAVFVVPGGAVVALAVWLRRRWLRRQAAAIDALIIPPRLIFGKADAGLRERTERRRKAANGIRARAAQVESGTPVQDLLRRAK